MTTPPQSTCSSSEWPCKQAISVVFWFTTFGGSNVLVLMASPSPEVGAGWRQLTLVPAAWGRPSGSRFACLGWIVAETSEEEGMDGEHVAVLSGFDAIDEEACCRPPSPVVRRPFRPESEALQEFWARAGYA